MTTLKKNKLLTTFSIIAGLILGLFVWTNAIRNDFRTLENGSNFAWNQLEIEIKHQASYFPEIIRNLPEDKKLENMKKFHEIYSQIAISNTLNEYAVSYQNLHSFLETIASTTNFNNDTFLKLNLRINDEAMLFNQHVSLYNTQLSVFPKNKVAQSFNLTQLKQFNI
ncbi:hypothetical protein HOG98_08055 [bacterium]|jgi:hypothetical protein|nr:hypothetical protein [bacterium]